MLVVYLYLCFIFSVRSLSMETTVMQNVYVLIIILLVAFIIAILSFYLMANKKEWNAFYFYKRHHFSVSLLLFCYPSLKIKLRNGYFIFINDRPRHHRSQCQT